MGNMQREGAAFVIPSRAEVLVPSVNQGLAKQGLIIDQVVWERRELGKQLPDSGSFHNINHANTQIHLSRNQLESAWDMW